jgi:hypothetical protein
VRTKLFALGIIFSWLLPFSAIGVQSTTSPPSSPPAVAVTASRPLQTPDPQFGQDRNAQPNPDEVKREKDMEKARNKERHASLKKDTDQLLELATQLKQSVDASSENKLSLEVIRKTEEVEKLAKKVRDKMKAN